MTYREKRFKAALPYIVLVIVFVIGLYIPEIGSVTIYVHIGYIALVLITAGVVFFRVKTPRVVLKISDAEVVVTGLRPGWWKWFQLSETTRIPFARLEKVECGKLYDGLAEGRKHLLKLDASRNAIFQRVCVFHYQDDNGTQCIYFPDIDLVKDFDSALVELRSKIGNKLELMKVARR